MWNLATDLHFSFQSSMGSAAPPSGFQSGNSYGLFKQAPVSPYSQFTASPLVSPPFGTVGGKCLFLHKKRCSSILGGSFIFLLIWSWPITAHQPALPSHMKNTPQGGRRLPVTVQRKALWRKGYLSSSVYMSSQVHATGRCCCDWLCLPSHPEHVADFALLAPGHR